MTLLDHDPLLDEDPGRAPGVLGRIDRECKRCEVKWNSASGMGCWNCGGTGMQIVGGWGFVGMQVAYRARRAH